MRLTHRRLLSKFSIDLPSSKPQYSLSLIRSFLHVVIRTIVEIYVLFRSIKSSERLLILATFVLDLFLKRLDALLGY